MSKIGNINAAVGLFLNGQNPTARYHSFRKCFEMVFTNMESWSTVVDLITKYGNTIKICRFLSHPHIGVRSTELASMSELGLEFVLTLSLFLVVVPLVDPHNLYLGSAHKREAPP